MKSAEEKWWYRWRQLKFFKTEHRHREWWNRAYQKRQRASFPEAYPEAYFSDPRLRNYWKAKRVC